MSSEQVSQKEFVRKYFLQRPNIAIPHAQSKTEIEESWLEETGKRMEDPDRMIRSLSQEGFLIKVTKGVYKYDPKNVHNVNLQDFTASVKKRVLERDGYKCIVCGLGKENGVELHVDHKKPKDLGGKATLENGQTLCAKHNFTKKNHHQLELGKKVFISLYEDSLSDMTENGKHINRFAKEILEIYKKYNIDSHVDRED